jgi:RNA polymerase sigma-70 factor (ECF subfamily)
MRRMANPPRRGRVPPEEMTDELMVRELASGEGEDVVRALYRTYGAGLYGFALRRLGDRGLAEEVVQDVLTRVWRSADDFDPSRASLRTWVYGIARNAMVDADRRRRVRPPLAPADATDDVADQSEPIEQAMTRWQVQEAIRELKPDHRQVIEMVYFRGMALRDVAGELGLPLGTVKSRCFYALENLRLAIDEQGASL